MDSEFIKIYKIGDNVESYWYNGKPVESLEYVEIKDIIHKKGESVISNSTKDSILKQIKRMLKDEIMGKVNASMSKLGNNNKISSNNSSSTNNLLSNYIMPCDCDLCLNNGLPEHLKNLPPPTTPSSLLEYLIVILYVMVKQQIKHHELQNKINGNNCNHNGNSSQQNHQLSKKESKQKQQHLYVHTRVIFSFMNDHKSLLPTLFPESGINLKQYISICFTNHPRIFKSGKNSKLFNATGYWTLIDSKIDPWSGNSGGLSNYTNSVNVYYSNSSGNNNSTQNNNSPIGLNNSSSISNSVNNNLVNINLNVTELNNLYETPPQQNSYSFPLFSIDQVSSDINYNNVNNINNNSTSSTTNNIINNNINNNSLYNIKRTKRNVAGPICGHPIRNGLVCQITGKCRWHHSEESNGNSNNNNINNNININNNNNNNCNNIDNDIDLNNSNSNIEIISNGYSSIPNTYSSSPLQNYHSSPLQNQSATILSTKKRPLFDESDEFEDDDDEPVFKKLNNSNTPNLNHFNNSHNNNVNNNNNNNNNNINLSFGNHNYYNNNNNFNINNNGNSLYNNPNFNVNNQNHNHNSNNSNHNNNSFFNYTHSHNSNNSNNNNNNNNHSYFNYINNSLTSFAHDLEKNILGQINLNSVLYKAFSSPPFNTNAMGLRIIKEFTRFVILRILDNDFESKKLQPPPLIDRFFQTLQSDSQKTKELSKVAQMDIYHNPDMSFDSREVQRKRYNRTFSLYQKHFYSSPPPDIWVSIDFNS